MQQSGRCWGLPGWRAGWGTPWCTQASQKNPRSPPNFIVLLGPSSSLSQYNQFAQHQQQLLCCSFLYNFKISSPCGTRVNRNPSLHWCKWRPIQLLQQSTSSPGLLIWPLWILLPTITHNSYQIATGRLFARELSKLNDSPKWNMTCNHFQARWEEINVQPWKKESFILSSVLLTEEWSAAYSNSGESWDEQLMASASLWIRLLKSSREWGWLPYPSALIEIRLKYTSD